MVWDINGVGRGLEEHDGLLLDLMLESVGSTRLETSSGGIFQGCLPSSARPHRGQLLLGDDPAVMKVDLVRRSAKTG
ncbi:hypothetical protein ACFX2H_022550 [Malus domestica]